MIAETTCPEAALLQRLVAGQLGEAEGSLLERHLAGCRRCAAMLQTQTCDDLLTHALRGPLQPHETRYHHLAAAVKATLKRHQFHQITATLPPRDTCSTDSSMQEGSEAPTFPFLRPPQGAEEIGRLGGYRVLDLIGAGGMGMVFRAEDPALRRLVALKVISPSRIASPEARERFFYEARSLAALEHDHIVTVYHVSEDNGVPFLAMQLLKGETLQQRLERTDDPLPLDDALAIARQIAVGLAAAHERGIIHRDIKPGNIWLETRGERSEERDEQTAGFRPSSFAPHVKILDFGLARVLGDELTRDGPAQRVVGTPAYMAPEQACGEPVDGQADLFSLGCVLYRMTTGRLPFEGSTMLQLIWQVTTEDAPPPRRFNPELPAEIESLIVHLMRKKPEERPTSTQAVAQALEQLEERRRPKPSRRRWLIGTAAAVVAAAAVTAWGAFTFLQPAPPEPGRITFDFDEPDARLALRLGDEDERIIDLAKDRTFSLPPGDYAWRPVADPGKRVLRPHRLLVKPGENKSVTVRLVGEIEARIVHAMPVRGLALVPRKAGLTVWSAGEDRCLFAWQPGIKDRPAQTLFPETAFSCAALAPDGRTLALGSADTTRKSGNLVRFWDTETARPWDGGFACPSQVNALAYSPDGARLLVGLNNGAVELRDARTGLLEARRDNSHDAGVFAVAFLPGGKRWLSSGWDGTLAEWTAEQKGAKVEIALVRRLPAHTGVVRGLAVLPKGKQAVTAGIDKAIRVWDLDTGKATATWTAPDPIHTLALSPDGSRLLTGDAKGAVRLWDIGTAKEVESFVAHKRAVTVIAFTPDGERAVSGDEAGAIVLWRLPK